MSYDEFLNQLGNILQTEADLSMETVLADLEEWDSLSAMSMMVFLDRSCGVKVTIPELAAFKTVADIAKKAGVIA